MKKSAKKRLEPVLFRVLMTGLAMILSASPAAGQVTSVLWGVSGEAWDPPTSQLADFTTDVGYQGNGGILPDWPVGVNITNFGAVADDMISDVDALRAALSNCPPYHAVFLPDGRYIIDDFIEVGPDNVVIRGESRDGTIIYFPKHSNEIKNVREDTTAMIQFSGGSNRGIEHLSLVFRDEQKATGYYRVPTKTKQFDPHWWWNGENPIRFDSWENNSWMRNIYIKNANHPVTIDTYSHHITILDVVLDQFIGRSDGPADGHMGIKLGHAVKHCLIHNIWITGNYVHDICPMGNNHCVFSRVKGHTVAIDHHAMGNYNNLYTEFDCGTGTHFGGANNNVEETYWGIKVYTDISYLSTNRNCKFIGLTTSDPTDIGSTWHHETLDPELLEPANIWLAQMACNNNTNTPPDRTLTLPPLTAPYQVPAVDDAQLWGGSNSNKNYAHGESIQLKGAVGNYHDRRAIMKFDLSGLGITNVANATLRFYGGSNGRMLGVQVYAVSDDSWSERTVTYATMPAHGSVLAGTNYIETAWYELDLTAHVNSELAGDQKVSLQMRSGGPGEWGDAFGSIHTQEGENGPLLVLHTETSTIPPPAQPTGLVAAPGDNRAILDWDDNTEDDFASYNVYRSSTSGSDYKLDAMGLLTSGYDGSYATNGGVYYFKVAAVDTAGTESILSSEVMVIPGAPAVMYSQWLALYPSLGSLTNLADDAEPDGVVNWIEYALGGSPVSNDAAGMLPEGSMGVDGGSNWLYLSYDRREDAAQRGLTYTVLSGTNLVEGLSNEVPAWSVSPATNGFETATHRMPTDEAPAGFMKLEIELAE